MAGLRDVTAVPHPAFDLGDLPSGLVIERVAADIERRFSSVQARVPSQADLDETYWRLVDLRDRGDDFGLMSRRDVRRAPWVMLGQHDGHVPLIEDHEFLRRYLVHIGRRPDGAALAQLYLAFLFTYPAAHGSFPGLCRALTQLLERCERRRCRKVRKQAVDYGLLGPEGPTRVWTSCSGDGRSVEAVLERAGLTGLLARAGFVRAVLERGIDDVGTQLGGAVDAGLDALLELATDPESGGRTLRLRIPASRVRLAEGLLLPFVERRPGDEAQAKVQAFVLSHCGDPRLDRTGWQGVSEEAVGVVLRWLVSDTLEDFFRLIEYVSKSDETARRHWRYRKAFWSAYLRADVIRDAWLVLSPAMDAAARQRLTNAEGGYGRLARGSGVLRNHAVLVLRIGDLVITDWSHSGSYRCWREGERRSRGSIPKLYRSQYRRGDLITSPGHRGTHHGAESGRWQGKLAAYIEDHTGVRMVTRELMPR